jgi:hypothetical protein
MRQVKETPKDIKFRTALSNIRYAACTPADLKYLRSRTVSRHPAHPTFEDPRFRHVSVITALKAHKDKINEFGCEKFAEETGQELVDFFSNDKVTDNAGSDERRTKGARKKKADKQTKNIPTPGRTSCGMLHRALQTNFLGNCDFASGCPS